MVGTGSWPSGLEWSVPSTWRRMPRKRLIDPLVLVIGLVVAVLDQLTKYWIVQLIGPSSAQHQIEVVGDLVRLTYVTNSGAAFGLFQGKTPILTLASFLAVPVLVFSPVVFPRATLLARLAVGLLLGGAVGNLLDRVRLGYVVDFVDVGIGNLRWPSFNVADSSFVVGVAILAIYLFFASEEEPSPEPSSQTDANDSSYAPERS